MIEEDLGRIAASLERIAAALEKAPVAARPRADQGPAPVLATQEVLKYHTNMGHSLLRKLCEARNIEVPPRTKIPTLIKWLEESDQMRAVQGGDRRKPSDAPVEKLAEKLVEKVIEKVAAVKPEPPKPEPAPEPEPPKPTPAPTPEPPDPFAVEEPELERTREDVLAALQRVQKAGGNGPVIDILQVQGGVVALKKLPPEKFAAVYNAAVAWGK